MSKRQKLSFFLIEGLPDEIILKILSLLDIKGVLQCGQVSRRLRNISNDQSLWSKLNLSEKQIPYDFIEKAVQNGCEYLNISYSSVHGGKKAEEPWKLKYLAMSQSADEWDEQKIIDFMTLDECVLEAHEGVLQNCHFLQKLAVENLTINSCEIEQICQNGETLQILNLDGCIINFKKRTKLIQKLLTKCTQLTELNIFKRSVSGLQFDYKILRDQHVCALVNNLTPNILKLNLGNQEYVTDEHVNTLVLRCNKITELGLSATSITNDSIEIIVKHLKSLEKLDLNFTNIDISSILQLKSIPTLKILRCFHGSFNDRIKYNVPKCYIATLEEIKNLKLQLPLITIDVISEEHLHIASSAKEVNVQGCFWEINAEEQDLFPEAD